MMDFPFNFIIIPTIFFALAYYSVRNAKAGLRPWYKELPKPDWAPSVRMLREMSLFLCALTGLAVMWYWNVPFAGWFKYITGAVLLAHAYYFRNLTADFFVEKDIPKSLQTLKYANITIIAAIVLMVVHSPIGAFLMLPYMVALGLATQIVKTLAKLKNKT
jgi:tryptophan-rich sensory protein